MTNWFYVRLIKRSVDGFFDHNGHLLAGYIAYSTLLAIFPFMIFAVALTGWMIGEERSSQALQSLFSLAPEHITLTLKPVVVEVLAQSHGLFNWIIVIAVWVAMGGVGGISTALDRAYSDRPSTLWWVEKIKALVVVIISSGVAVAMGMLILFTPYMLTVLRRLTPFEWGMNIHFYRYIIGIAVFYAFLLFLHKYLPTKHARGIAVWPGVLISTISWIGVASGLSYYLSYAGNYNITYGALAGVVITLLFLYVSGCIVILGAEINGAYRRMKKEDKV